MADGVLDGGVASEELAALIAAADAYLAEIELGLLHKLTDADLLAEMQELEWQSRRMVTVWHSLISLLHQRCLPERTGTTSISALLQTLLRLSPTEAKQRVAAAADLGPRVGLSGEWLRPHLEVVAAAQAAGELSAEHCRGIAKIIDRLPPSTSVADRSAVEHQLVAAASRHRPRDVEQLGERILAHLDPDGVLASDEEHERRRSFDLIPLADGSYRARGYLTPAGGAQLMAALNPGSAPEPASDGTADARTPGQRRHDSLTELAGFRLRRNELLDSRGATQLIITMTVDQLSTGEGLAETSFGQLLSARTALELADEAALAFILRDARGAVLAEGRSRRLATRGQTLALIARDRGCSFPGCDRPPDWTQRHHVVAWVDGGRTDIDNLTLLCGQHHRSFDRSGWRCEMRHGLPWWIPPPWLDRRQEPQLNHRISHG